MRLNKYISESGLCSRRQADRFIEQGVVTINGHRAGVGAQVRVGDFVSVQGRAIEPREKSRTVLIALNKPVGIVSTTEQSEPANIVKFVSHPERIFPIGRLDKDSQGLIFLTSDGDLVNKILRAGNEHEKEYLVTVNKPVTDAFIDGMAGGVPMLGQMTKRCTAERVADRVFRIVLVQGLNRQIRRMCEHFGYGVEKLERTRIMHVSLAGIASGDWRDLTDEELAELDRLLEGSTGEATAKKSSRKAPKGASASGSGKAAVTTGGPTKAARAAAKKRAHQRKAKPKKRTTRKPGARVGKQAGPNKGRRRR